MDSDNSALKWTAAAVGVILVCFCLGYYVLGPNARRGTGTTDPNGITIVALKPSPSPSDTGIFITEKTAEIEAKRKKLAEAAAKKKADDEAKKLAEDAAAKLKAEAAAAKKAAEATPTPTPSPDPTPTPEETASPDATPTPESTDEPTPTPAPTATPVSKIIYRVRVGSYDSQDTARSLATELNGRGYSTSVVIDRSGDKTLYQIQVGAFRDEKTAKDTQKELKTNGYEATISKS